MKPFLRSILAVVLGMILAMTLIGINESVVSRMFFSLPEGTDMNDAEALREAVRHMPTEAFALILAGWILGVFAGGWLAACIAGRARMVHSGIIGALMTLATIGNLMALPHPLWVNIVAPTILIPVSLLATMLVPRRPAQTASSTTE